MNFEEIKKRNVNFKIHTRGRGRRDKTRSNSRSSHSSKRKNSETFTWMPRKVSDPLGDYKPPFKIRERSRAKKEEE